MLRNTLLRTTAVAGFLAAMTVGALAQSSQPTTLTGYAGTIVFGGGSTLAENLYNRTVAAITGTSGLVYNATTGTADFVYDEDGSGSGQKAFIQQTPATHADVTGYTGTAVHFGASDAYLSAAQIDCWNDGPTSGSDASGGCAAAGYAVPAASAKSKGGPIIQLPAFGTAVAIPLTALYTKAITLNNNDLCGIFSGKITNWNNISGTTTTVAGVVETPPSLNGTINVVYREDGSGTSFLLTQHLAKVCNTTNTLAGVTFVATKYFADVFGSANETTTGSNHFVSQSANSGAWANFVGASGSGGVANQLYTTTNGIAYLTPDWTSVAPSSIPNSTYNSTTGTWVPNTTSKYLSLRTAKVVNAHAAKAYAPNVGGTSTALKNPNYAVGDSNPSAPSTLAEAMNPNTWIPIVSDPLSGYPIVGYTTLVFAQCYSDPHVSADIAAFLTQLYNTSNKTNLTLEGFTTAPAVLLAAIKNSFYNNKYAFGIDIEDGVTTTSGSYTYNGGVCAPTIASGSSSATAGVTFKGL
jgi:ABC-type phosphate transport system substrate-binding protein